MWTVTDANGFPTAAYPLGYAATSRTIIEQGTTTYTPPNGCRAILVECIGAGAGGGGVADAATNGAGAGGGGGGAYSAKFIVGPKASYACVVGAFGAGGASGANNGSNGSDTTFDSPSVCTAKGGLGGAGITTAAGPIVGGIGGVGGAASSGVGDIKLDGCPGEHGHMYAAAQNASGVGARGPMGSGAIAVKTSAAGVAANNYGGGGSGAANQSSASSNAGGNGANGLIIVWEFA